MKFLHKFKTQEAFNRAYNPDPQGVGDDGRFVIAIVVGGVTYTYSEPGPNNYYIWVNGDDWVDSNGVRHPQAGGDAYIMGQEQTTIDSVILQEADSDSEEEPVVLYTQPWTSWVVGGAVTYNKYHCNFNGHDYVDLGLPSGTLWATKNLGATNVGDPGSFFAWGETSSKESFTLENYSLYSSGNYTKYNETDGKRTLDLSDDAAHVLWGGDWHMPTREQIVEFCECMDYSFDAYPNAEYRGYVSRINGNVIWMWPGGEGIGQMSGSQIAGLTRYTYNMLSNSLSTR